MQQMIVRYLLVNGHVLDVVMRADTAMKVTHDWETCAVDLKGVKRIGGVDETGRRWAVELSQVQGVLCLSMEQAAPQGQMQQPWQPKSGPY